VVKEAFALSASRLQVSVEAAVMNTNTEEVEGNESKKW